MRWTGAMVARLKVLHADGRTRGETARTLSREFRRTISRGAVCGKAWHVGLRRRRKAA